MPPRKPIAAALSRGTTNVFPWFRTVFTSVTVPSGAPPALGGGTGEELVSSVERWPRFTERDPRLVQPSPRAGGLPLQPLGPWRTIRRPRRPGSLWAAGGEWQAAASPSHTPVSVSPPPAAAVAGHLCAAEPSRAAPPACRPQGLEGGRTGCRLLSPLRAQGRYLRDRRRAAGTLGGDSPEGGAGSRSACARGERQPPLALPEAAGSGVSRLGGGCRGAQPFLFFRRCAAGGSGL